MPATFGFVQAASASKTPPSQSTRPSRVARQSAIPASTTGAASGRADAAYETSVKHEALNATASPTIFRLSGRARQTIHASMPYQAQRAIARPPGEATPAGRNETSQAQMGT